MPVRQDMWEYRAQTPDSSEDHTGQWNTGSQRDAGMKLIHEQVLPPYDSVTGAHA